MSRQDERERELALHLGYSMTLGAERSSLRLRAPDGRLCVTIALTPGGAAVEISASALAIATAGDVSIECERFRVAARGDAIIQAGGDLALGAGGAVGIAAGAALTTEAAEQRHEARLRDIRLLANDDVCLDGERIRLNDPPAARASASRALLRYGTDTSEGAPCSKS